MNNDKCMGPIGDLGAKPIEVKPISKAKWESSATDRYLDSSSNKHRDHKEGSKADKAADEKARQDINRMAKHSK